MMSQPSAPANTPSAAELGIVAGTALDTDRGRQNRAEQQRRAAAYASDQVSVSGGVRPDGSIEPAPQPNAKARARAADFVPTYQRWTDLGYDGRTDRLESIINAHLAREGVPAVRVVFGGSAPGSAIFSPAMWSIALSRQVVETDPIPVDTFAELVENMVHETQHAVTTFRAIRVAAADNGLDPNVQVDDQAILAAHAANARRHPSLELDEHARREALEIYQVSIDPQRASGQQVPAAGVDRAAVMARLQLASASLGTARELMDLDRLLAGQAPHDQARQANLAASTAAYQESLAELTTAHNAYLALPEETVSWRAGAAANAAVRERISILERLSSARAQVIAASSEERDLRTAGDQQGAVAALRRRLAALEQATAARAQLAGLTSSEPTMVGGRREVRSTPLTQHEIDHAPIASPLPDAGGGPGMASLRLRPAQGSGAAGPALSANATETIAPGAHPSAVTKAALVDTGGGIGGEVSRQRGLDTGDVATSAERGLGVVVGGDNALAVSARHTQTATAGMDSSTATTTGGVSLGKDGALQASVGRVGVVAGVDTTGRPVSTTSSTTAGVALTDQGLGVKGARSTTNAAGTTTSLTGGFTTDAKGNTSVEVGGGLALAGGSGVTTTFRAGHQVDAADPVEVQPGVFEVSYSVTDSTAAGVGGTASPSRAGPGVGASLGSSSSTSRTGVRRFSNKALADRFKSSAASLIDLQDGPAALTTLEGALAIPVGESRGSGRSAGGSWGVSASYGASLGYGRQQTTSHQVVVRRVSQNLVEVSAVVMGESTADVSIAGGITDTKGSTDTAAVSQTYRFDLATPQGQAAYLVYTSSGIPSPAGTLVASGRAGGAEEHDRVQVGPLGQAQWGRRTFESLTTTDQGVSAVYGGEQSHDQKPSRVGRWLGEDELHSRAVLTAASQNGQPVGYHAEVSVKSDSGEYNREQFGAIFLGAQKGKSTAKPSGDWTLSADIEAKVIKDLEQNSAAFRHARTDEERMRILSGLFKEGGARAAGGLVRAGGKSQVAWSLELKGDENFPGPAGRQRLKDQQRALLAALVGSPDTADAIVVEARDATTKLEQRRRAVADPEKYTDLPEELRQQQVALIDDHLRDFRKVAEQALRVALRVDRGEAGSATTDPGRRRPGSTVSSDVSPAQAGADRLRERAEVLQADVDSLVKQIFIGSKAIHVGAQSVAPGITMAQLNEQSASWKDHLRLAYTLDGRQAALKGTADGLRQAWFDATDPDVRIAKLTALVSRLEERRQLLTLQHEQLVRAAAAIKPMTTPAAMARHPDFWAQVEADDLSE